MRTWKTCLTLAALPVALLLASPALATHTGGPVGTLVVHGPKGTCDGNVTANAGWAFVEVAPSSYDFVIPTPLAPVNFTGLELIYGGFGAPSAGVFISPTIGGASLAGLVLALSSVEYTQMETSGNPTDGASLFLNVDCDGDTVQDDFLIYYPVANGCLGAGSTWTTCVITPGSGGFVAGLGTAAACTYPTPPFDLTSFVGANPASAFPGFPTPALGFGSYLGPSGTPNSSYVDTLELKFLAPVFSGFDHIQFDFEDNCLETLTLPQYAGDADADCYCESGNPLVLNRDQCVGPPAITTDDNYDANGDFNNDTDGDGARECIDVCFADPAKIFPGACGCGVPDTDTDTDTVADCVDNCPADANTDQADGDADTVGDVCDNCPADANASQDDGDGDGVGDVCDNCPGVANAGQEDLDSDGAGDVCDDDDGAGLSLRRAIVALSPAAGKDRWSGQAELDTTLTPTFLADADASGITLALRDDNGVVIDSETWTGADCVRIGKNGSALKCKNAVGSQARFAKRPSVSFFRLTISVRNQALFGPALADTPLHVRLTTPVGIDRNDFVDACKQNANGRRTVCKETP
jgi:hypothetical protein